MSLRMTRFREHRGGLAESMLTAREISSRSELVAHMRAELSRYGFAFADNAVRIEPYGGDDERIGWKDVHIVIVEGYGPFGFIEGPCPGSTGDRQ